MYCVCINECYNAKFVMCSCLSFFDFCTNGSFYFYFTSQCGLVLTDENFSITNYASIIRPQGKFPSPQIGKGGHNRNIALAINCNALSTFPVPPFFQGNKKFLLFPNNIVPVSVVTIKTNDGNSFPLPITHGR